MSKGITENFFSSIFGPRHRRIDIHQHHVPCLSHCGPAEIRIIHQNLGVIGDDYHNTVALTYSYSGHQWHADHGPGPGGAADRGEHRTRSLCADEAP